MLIANFRTRQVLHRLGHPLISAKLLDLAGPRPALDQGIPVMTSRRPIRGLLVGHLPNARRML